MAWTLTLHRRWVVAGNVNSVAAWAWPFSSWLFNEATHIVQVVLVGSEAIQDAIGALCARLAIVEHVAYLKLMAYWGILEFLSYQVQKHSHSFRIGDCLGDGTNLESI